MKHTIITVKELIKGKVPFDLIGKKNNGNFYIMESFYYKTLSAKKIAEDLKELIPNIVIVKTNDVWKPFIGGAPVQKQSHYYVEFKIVE